MDPSRHWEPKFGNLDITIQKCFSINSTQTHPDGFKLSRHIHIPISTIPDIIKEKPNIVITTEVGVRTIQALLLGKLTRKFKTIVQLRESEKTNELRGPIRKFIRRQLLPLADNIIVNGESGKRVVEAYGVNPQKIHIIRSGTDTTNFGKKLALHPNYGPLKLIYSGDISPRKGINQFLIDLADILEENPEIEVHLTIASFDPIIHGPLPKNLNTCHIGWIKYENLEDAYCNHHVAVMPSLADEWGMVVNEAMAAGIPVIGSNAAQAIQELVVNHKSGWTYEPNSQSERKKAILAMLRTPRDIIREMGWAAHKTATENTDTKCVVEFQNIIQKTLNT